MINKLFYIVYGRFRLSYSSIYSILTVIIYHSSLLEIDFAFDLCEGSTVRREI